MSAEKSLTLVEKNFSESDVTLIKQTVAKGATDNELKLFLYRCKNMGLDPLKPGQVHFIKYGTNPGTIVVGIDGFRTKAANTKKHVGTKRGVIRDDKGSVIGAWCEVYRSDWTEPAREEVSLAEYSTGKAMWLKMPETMIKKVAEVAALRMAFPDELGGLYSHEEMEQSRPREARTVIPEVQSRPEFEEIELEPHEEIVEELTPSDYELKAGRSKGKRLKDMTVPKLNEWIAWYDDKVKAGTRFHQDVDEDAFHIRAFLDEQPKVIA